MALGIGYIYEFFPVGQGLFGYGSLHGPDSPWPKSGSIPFFQWVYDCGTNSRPQGAILDRALDIFDTRRNRRARLDLLFISHFHEDHVSGIKKLLQRVGRVGTVVLPYITFDRLVLYAVQEGFDPSSEGFHLLTDPVGFLTGLEGVEIEQILFVLPGSGSEGVPEGPPAKAPNAPEGKLSIVDQESAPVNPEGNEHLKAYGENWNGTKIGFLSAQAHFQVDRFWEFVMYNVASHDPLDQSWKDAVVAAKTKLEVSGDRAERISAYEVIEKLYTEKFSTGIQNHISLFVYSGPLPPSERWKWWRPRARVYTPPLAPNRTIYVEVHSHNHRSKCSLIYTGDGYLKKDDEVLRFNRHFGQNRINQCAVFQVMHHGSKANAASDLAGQIAPCYSVFSSEPAKGNTYHPHHEVLMDFLPYCPIGVDLKRGVQFLGLVSW